MNRPFLLSVTGQGTAAGALAAVSLLLPWDFFNQLHGMLMEMGPLDLISVYAYGWIAYLIVGGLAGGLIALLGTSVLVFCHRHSYKTVRLLLLWIVAVVLTRVLFRGSLAYLEGMVGDGLRNSLERIVSGAVSNTFILGLSVWLIFRHAALLIHLRGFLIAIAGCGALIVGVAILTAALRSNPPLRKVASSMARPPVILITIDPLAANHMSLYGYGRATTPSLDKLARQSVVFEGHYTNGNFTTPSISSILYGVRPWVHRAFQLMARPLPDLAPDSLLAAAQGSGYQTLAVTTNIWASPMHHRVEAWVVRSAYGRPDSLELNIPKYFPQSGPLLYFRSIYLLLETYHIVEARNAGNLQYDPERAFSKAREMLSNSQGGEGPPFLWIHLLPPHDPYSSPAPFLTRFELSSHARTRYNSSPPYLFEAAERPDFPGAFLGRYDEAILYVDHHLGRFLDWLRQQGRFDGALLIVTADHGESFSHGYGTHNGPMLHEDLIHVPLLVKLPHQREQFMPKLADALYDLAVDPGENKNLISNMPDRASQMRAAIEAQVRAHSMPGQ